MVQLTTKYHHHRQPPHSIVARAVSSLQRVCKTVGRCGSSNPAVAVPVIADGYAFNVKEE